MKISITTTGIALVCALCGAPESRSDEETASSWYRSGAQAVAERRERLEAAEAKNIILFVGDGMSMATITAARILAGQRAGKPGESHRLAFERFPHTALARTYNTNQQTPDSAGTMTAMATGAKSFAGAIAVDQRAERGACEPSRGRELVSLLDLAKSAGLPAGIVTTARVTHATPAALFAKSPERGWESDRGLPAEARTSGCRDIARQLVDYDLGGGVDVVFGGGRTAFLPESASDPEYPDVRGRREDATDLLDLWRERSENGQFAWNRKSFDALETGSGGNVLGLFEPSHMQYEHDRPEDSAGEPSLVEMTLKALDVLESRSRDGYVLVVEGARIDHAHHAGNAHRALVDTIAFSDAVSATVDRVDAEDTLVIVTADHGHALAFGGYASRGSPILGLVEGPGPAGEAQRLARDKDGKPYTTLTYYNGPGHRGGERPDYDEIDPEHPDFRQEATIGMRSSTHSGEDVPVYGMGPGAEVLGGSMEQHLIFHAMLQAQPEMSHRAAEIAGEDGLPDWARLNAD
ncbi:MAG: alkaline phosphatase [Wenzhouxiangellaceae bacterium]|nr:alkaline phosphatase [Wenzhouxiangellaceae bacterium]MBS3823483.1 alkaline phosphatase [Wenzhouxiangellaceae bacterium]